MVRRGDDGYRIPTPAEDDWERQRSGLAPKPGDISRLHAEIVTRPLAAAARPRPPWGNHLQGRPLHQRPPGGGRRYARHT